MPNRLVQRSFRTHIHGAGAEFAVSDVLAIRGQYVLQYYPSGLGTFHQGLVGLVWHIQ